jgi:hypothetical protein
MLHSTFPDAEMVALDSWVIVAPVKLFSKEKIFIFTSDEYDGVDG